MDFTFVRNSQEDIAIGERLFYLLLHWYGTDDATLFAPNILKNWLEPLLHTRQILTRIENVKGQFRIDVYVAFLLKSQVQC